MRDDAVFGLLDGLVVPAAVYDTAGRTLHVNPAGVRAAGYPNEDLRGTHFSEHLPPDAVEQVTAAFEHAFATGEPVDFETHFIDALGHTRYTRAQLLPFTDEEGVTGVLTLAFAAPDSTIASVETQPHLTPRQRQVLTLIAMGYSTSQIAKRLSLSTETVRNHLRALYALLGVHTRTQAIAAAHRVGLLGLQPLGPADGATDAS